MQSIQKQRPYDADAYVTLYDRDDFKQYCERVLSKMTNEFQSVGDLKRSLGIHYRADWMADALDSIRSEIEVKGVKPERYRKISRLARKHDGLRFDWEFSR